MRFPVCYGEDPARGYQVIRRAARFLTQLIVTRQGAVDLVGMPNMKQPKSRHFTSAVAPVAALALLVAASSPLLAGDYPMFGGNASRNMVSSETNLPDTF